jgi:hypothetical protein
MHKEVSMPQVVVVIGAGSIGQAVARRICAVGNMAALLMGPEGAFITGSDVLMDGGVTASFFYGELAP